MKDIEAVLTRLGLPASLRTLIVSIIYGILLFAALWAMGFEQGRFKYLDW